MKDATDAYFKKPHESSVVPLTMTLIHKLNLKKITVQDIIKAYSKYTIDKWGIDPLTTLNKNMLYDFKDDFVDEAVYRPNIKRHFSKLYAKKVDNDFNLPAFFRMTLPILPLISDNLFHIDRKNYDNVLGKNFVDMALQLQKDA